MLMHAIGCPSLLGGDCSCDPIEVNFPDPGFNRPGQKARPIDSNQPFEFEIVYTPKMQAVIKRAADPDCVICLGRGLNDTPKGWQMCSCLKV